MCDTGVWDRDATTVLIMAYETFPNLYVTTNQDYKLKNKRMDSISTVKTILCGSGVDFSVEEINKKIHSLRTQFFKEYSKVKKSLVSGAGTLDIYIPKLWCYELLQFLVTSDPVRNSSSNLDMTNVKPSKKSDVMPDSSYEPNPTEKPADFMQLGCSDYKLNDEENEILYDGPAENLVNEIHITPPAKKMKKATKNIMEKEAIQLIGKASNVLNTIIIDNQKNKHVVQEDISAFGSVIIEELKKINDEEEMRVAKREILNSVLNAQERATAKRNM